MNTSVSVGIRRIRVALLVFLAVLALVPAQIMFAAPLLSVAPGQSIQAAIDAAASGATLLVEDGIYYEQLTIKKPLTLRAITPGNVTISGARSSALTFSAVSGTTGLYSAPASWQVRAVMLKQRTLLDYKTLTDLKAFTFPITSKSPTAVPGPQEGFAWVNGKLYIRLLGSANPNKQPLEVSRDGSGVAITVLSNDVSIEGLRIHLWPTYGVDVRTGRQRVAIRDSFFDGTPLGIYATGGLSLRKELTIERNEFNGGTLYDMRRAGGMNVWKALYESNLSSRFVRANMVGIYIRNNYIYDVFDGIEVKGFDATPTDVQSEVSGNVIERVVDNPLEFDTDQKYLNMRVHHNVLLDGYVYLSMAPFQAGKLLVDHNIFYTSPEQGLEDTTWLKTCSHAGVDYTVPLRGMTIAYNTVVLGDSATQASRLYVACDSETASYTKSVVVNNIMKVQKLRGWKLSGFSFSAANLLKGTPARGEVVPPAIYADPGFVSLSPMADFDLRSDSIAVAKAETMKSQPGLAGSAEDLGAIPLGMAWELGRPGPQWAATGSIAGRPSLPASLTPSFAGFGS